MASSGAHLAWLVTAVACQFLWGTYPAAVRYMQTRAKHPLTSLQLSLLINLLACPALFFGTTLPLWLQQQCRRHQRKHAAGAGAGRHAASKPLPSNGKHPGCIYDSAAAEPLLGPIEEEAQEREQERWQGQEQEQGQGQRQVESFAGGTDLEAASPGLAPPTPNGVHQKGSPSNQQQAVQAVQAVQTQGAVQAVHDGGRPAGGPGWRQQAGLLALTTLFLSILFLSQVFSLLFTTAYLSQMVFLMAPVIVAFMAKALFKSPLPPGLWPALILMLLGCGMVIGSKAMAAASGRAAENPTPASSQQAILLTSAGAGSVAGADPAHAMSAVPSAHATSAPGVTLWADRHEESWLCTAFGKERSSWLCGLDLDAATDREELGSMGSTIHDASSTSGSSHSSSGTDESLGKKGGKKPKPPKPPNPGSGSGLGMHDVLGIGLAFFGAVCLAAFMTVVQRARGAVSDQQVMWANFLTQAPACFALTFFLERDRFPVLLHLGWLELGEVFAIATGVNWFGNWMQQMCIRKLGAPQAAAFLPVRLLGSLAASYPLLNEGLEGPLQWGGAGLLLAAVTWYLLQQKKAAEGGSRSTAAVMEAEAEAPAYVA